jgi:hypothetical protein
MAWHSRVEFGISGCKPVPARCDQFFRSSSAFRQEPQSLEYRPVPKAFGNAYQLFRGASALAQKIIETITYMANPATNGRIVEHIDDGLSRTGYLNLNPAAP